MNYFFKVKIKNIFTCIIIKRICFLYIIIFSSIVFAVDYGNDIQNEITEKNIPLADPTLTKVIKKNKEYVILYNPKEFNDKTTFYQANNICAEFHNKEKFQIEFKYRIGVYTTFYSCSEEKFLFNKNLSQKESKIRSLQFIYDVREENIIKINNFEKNGEENRLNKYMNHVISIKTQTCKKFGIIEGSKEWFECLLALNIILQDISIE